MQIQLISRLIGIDEGGQYQFIISMIQILLLKAFNYTGPEYSLDRNILQLT